MYSSRLSFYHGSMKDVRAIRIIGQRSAATTRVPPHLFFLVSAIFHYLGPAFAVLLFSRVGVLGVAWLRIASAAVVFALWRQPWRIFAGQSWSQRRVFITLGIVLGAMNVCFYLAIARLPLGTVGALEFLGPITLAAIGARTRRNVLALGFAVAGVWFLTDVRLAGAPLGFVVRLCQLRVVHAVRRAWAPDRAGWGQSRH